MTYDDWKATDDHDLVASLEQEEPVPELALTIAEMVLRNLGWSDADAYVRGCSAEELLETIDTETKCAARSP